MSDTTAAMRVAIRTEGNTINAYAARLGTMDGAVLMGSINRRLCEVDRAVFEAFVSAMSLAMAAMLKDACGLAVSAFEVREAPEGEKAGHA